jgi:hypothetical protein
LATITYPDLPPSGAGPLLVVVTVGTNMAGVVR